MHSPIKKLFINDTEDKNINNTNIINKYCFVIVFTGRCGSTWLGKLLGNTKCCGHIDEFFNEDFIRFQLKEFGEITFNEYLLKISQRFGFEHGFGFEIDPMRLAWLQHYNTMNVTNFFKKIGCVFFMTRNDLLAQAYSFARAKSSGVWHNINNSMKSVDKSTDKIDDYTIWTEMLSLIYSEYWAENAFNASETKPIRITYEELATDYIQTVSKILIAIGRYPEKGLIINNYEQNITKKIKYSSKDDVLNKFYSKNYRLLIEIQEMRKKIHPITDYISLLDAHGIAFNKKSVGHYK